MLKTYEALFIFDHSLDDEALGRVLQKTAETLTRLGGKVLDTQMMGKRTFARPLKKRETGQYVRLVVALEPDKVEPLRQRLKLDESIFRVQIVRQSSKSVKQASQEKQGGES